MVPFYDNYPLEPDNDGWVDIDRIYCFDWDAFDRHTMDHLWRVFWALPQSGRYDLNRCPWWYSEQEDIDVGYLHGSVEISGLQVYGSLPFETWQEWDRAFQAKVTGFPYRTL